jgi:hypothetical protein
MDVYSYYRDHERECEIAFYRSSLDRPAALPALVYAYVHKDQATLDELLAGATEDVRRCYQKMLN